MQNNLETNGVKARAREPQLLRNQIAQAEFIRQQALFQLQLMMEALAATEVTHREFIMSESSLDETVALIRECSERVVVTLRHLLSKAEAEGFEDGSEEDFRITGVARVQMKFLSASVGNAVATALEQLPQAVMTKIRETTAAQQAIF